jgi:hypothetical protein
MPHEIFMTLCALFLYKGKIASACFINSYALLQVATSEKKVGCLARLCWWQPKDAGRRW